MLAELLLVAAGAYASVYALMVGAGASTFLWHKNLHNDPQRPEKPYLFTEVNPDAVKCILFGGNVRAYLMESSTGSCFVWQTPSFDHFPDPHNAADWEIINDPARPKVRGPLWSSFGLLSPWYATKKMVRAVTGTHLVLQPLGWTVETRDFRRIRYDIVDAGDNKQEEVYEPVKDRSDHLIHAQFQLHVISAGVPTLQSYNVKFHVVITLRCTNPALGFWEARSWEHQIAVRVQNLIREFAQGADIRQVYAGRQLSPEDKRALAEFIRGGLEGVTADPSATPPRVERENFLRPLGFTLVKEVDVRDPDLEPERATAIEGFLAAEFEGEQEGSRRKKILEGEAIGRARVVIEELDAAAKHQDLAGVYLQTRAGVEAAKSADHVDALIGMGGNDQAVQTAILSGIRSGLQQPPAGGTPQQTQTGAPQPPVPPTNASAGQKTRRRRRRNNRP